MPQPYPPLRIISNNPTPQRGSHLCEMNALVQRALIVNRNASTEFYNRFTRQAVQRWQQR